MTEQQLEGHGVYLGFIAFAVVVVVILAVAALVEARAARKPILPPAFICPDCGARSWHPDDGRYGYCGRCKRHTGRRLTVWTSPRPQGGSA